jgi:uncharacterized protein (UPF0335 family)
MLKINALIKELATDVKNMITELFQSGYSRRKIGDILKIPKSTVIRKFVVDTMLKINALIMSDVNDVRARPFKLSQL